MSQYELADACCFSRSHLSRIEIGGELPSVRLLEKMAAALGISMRAFFDDRYVVTDDSFMVKLLALLASLSPERRSRAVVALAKMVGTRAPENFGGVRGEDESSKSNAA